MRSDPGHALSPKIRRDRTSQANRTHEISTAPSSGDVPFNLANTMRFPILQTHVLSPTTAYAKTYPSQDEKTADWQ